jgi:4-amino-4-deoxy-L-arabinose transferase-like glycosyltransferase
VQRHGPAAVGGILSGVAAGLPFEEAFRRATGESLGQAEESFWERQTFWYRWVPLLTSSVTLWLLVTLLALWAMGKRRARDAAQRRLWDEEEERRLAESAVPVAPPDEWVN